MTKKKILLITPSRIIARGITSILEEHGGFTVETVLTDLSRENEATVRDSMTDIVIVDPIIFDFASRPAGRSRISDLTDAAVIAAPTAVTDDETINPDSRHGRRDHKKLRRDHQHLRHPGGRHQQAPELPGAVIRRPPDREPGGTLRP